MADKAVSKLTQVVNHAAIGNCFMVAQKGSGAGSTNRASVSALQVNYSRVANSYPFGNGDGNAYGVRTLATSAPAFQTINDMWYDTTASSWTASNSTVYVINQSTNAFIKAASVYVKQAGAWTQVKEAWIKDNGVWIKFLYVKPVVPITITGGYNINLRSVYQAQTGDYSSTPVDVSFVVTGNIGSTSISLASLVTGIWPTGSKIYLTNYAIIAGKGGDGGTTSGGTSSPCTCFGSSGGYTSSTAGTNGGNAISLDYALAINNNGTIGGGGGGGTTVALPYAVSNVQPVRGGGGAGINAGVAGGEGTCKGSGSFRGVFGSNGTELAGGLGGSTSANRDAAYATAGNGGALGQPSTQGWSSYNNCAYRNKVYTSTQSPGYALVSNGKAYTLTGNTLVGPIS